MEKSELIKLSKSEKQLLSKIDEDSKWIDLKQIKKINEELQDLGIYSSQIGKKCSKYLNEAGLTGELDIDTLFDNCYEARLAKKKKLKAENKIKDKKGKAGLAKGNIGGKNPPQTQTTQTNKSESSVIKKAKEIGKYITDLLTTSKRGDGWKENITKYITKIGMESLLSIVYGVMGTTDNQIGQFVIGSTALGLIGSIYAYVYELKTGQKITIEIKKWITGKLNELFDYLNKLGITVFKKPKPPGNGGGGGDMPEPRQAVARQPRQTVSSMLSAILGQQTAQQTQNLMNANNQRLFEQNTVNPLSNTQTTESILRQQKAETESLNTDTAQQESSYFNNIMSAGVAGTLGGAGWYANHISNLPQGDLPQGDLGDMVSDALPRDMNMPQPVEDNIDLEDIGLPKNKMNRERDTELKRVKDELDKINKQKKEEKDIEDKVKKQIDDLDLHGQAWGIANPAFHNAGKMAQSAMSSLLFSGNTIDEQYNQELLLQDIANQAQENIAKVEEENRQTIAMGLINAREGNTEERKVSEAEQEFLKQQEQIKSDIDNKIEEAQEDMGFVKYERTISEMERDQAQMEAEDELDTEILENYGVDIRNEMNIEAQKFEAEMAGFTAQERTLSDMDRAMEEMSRVNSNYSTDLDPLLSATPRNDMAVALSLVPNQSERVRNDMDSLFALFEGEGVFGEGINLRDELSSETIEAFKERFIAEEIAEANESLLVPNQPAPQSNWLSLVPDNNIFSAMPN